MLGDDDIGRLAALRRLGQAEEVRTVDEQDHIGVLLDGTGLAEVAEHRLAVALFALHRLAGQLGQGDDRDVELLGGRLEGTGDGRDFLLAQAAEVGRTLHQLEVVHDDQADLLLLDEAFGLGAELGQRQARGVVDVEGGLGEVRQRHVELLPLVGLQRNAALDLVGREARLGGHQTLDELDGGHFEGEHRDGDVVVHRGVAGEVEGEGRLTDGRTGRQDDEVRRLPAHGDAVEARETGRDAVEAGPALHFLDLVHRRIDQRADLLDILAGVVLDGVVDLRLGGVDEVVDIDGLVVGILEDPVRGGNQLALDVLLLEDPDVILDVGRRADLLGQVHQRHGAADRLEVALGGQFGGDGDDVDGGVLVDEGVHRFEDHPVDGIVEAGRTEFLHRFVDDGGLDQHGAEDGLFNIKSLRGFCTHLKPKCFQVDLLLLPADSGFFRRCRHGRENYSAFGLMMIRPQCSQMTSFLPLAMSIRRCGVILLKQPPQAPPTMLTTARWLLTLWRMRS